MPFRDHVWPKFLRENADARLQARLSDRVRRKPRGGRRRRHRGRLPEVARGDVRVLRVHPQGLARHGRRKEGGLEFPAGYMFKDVPKWESDDMGDPVEMLLPRARSGTASRRRSSASRTRSASARCASFPTRSSRASASTPTRAWRRCARSTATRTSSTCKAVGAFPAGLYPQVALNDKKFYPIYMKCIELDVAFCSTAGVPGPAPAVTRRRTSRYIDEVCWFFPELRFVTRHGCEPWTALAVKLLLKWPNLYYSTTAFAPKYYPKDIIDFANTRGADKVMFSGYFPAGLTYDRIFTRDARRAVPRPRVAEVPARERATRLQAPVRMTVPACNAAFEDARASVGVIDTMIGFPTPREEQAKHVRLHPQADARRRERRNGSSPRSTCSRACRTTTSVDDPVEMLVRRWTSTASRKALTGIGRPRATPNDALRALPRPVLRRRAASTRTRAWTRCARSTRAVKEHGAKARALLGHGPHPAGAAERQEDVPDLRQVRGARHPDLRVRRRARAAHPLRAAVRRRCSTRCAGSSPS